MLVLFGWFFYLKVFFVMRKVLSQRFLTGQQTQIVCCFLGFFGVCCSGPLLSVLALEDHELETKL